MQCLSCLLAHIILKLSYREVSHLIFSVKVYHKPTTPPTKVTRQKKAFWSPSTVSCLIELLFFFLFHSRVTSYTSNTAGKAVIRKQLWQTLGCPNNVTTMRDDCCLRLHIVDRWGVRSGVGRVVCSRYECILWIKYLRIRGDLLMQYLQTACKIEQRSLALAMSWYDRFFLSTKKM